MKTNNDWRLQQRMHVYEYNYIGILYTCIYKIYYNINKNLQVLLSSYISFLVLSL